MKIVVLAGGLSPERNVSLASGTRIAHALRTMGHQTALVDLWFGLEEYGSTPGTLFDLPIPDRWEQVAPEAPDLRAVQAARRQQSASQFGPGVLTLCRQADIVFLALHGTCGEDGRVQAAFDLLGIPYTGSGYLASGVALDKDLTKRLIAGQGVATPAWRRIRRTDEDLSRLAEETPLPCVVKPVGSGSSIGVQIVRSPAALQTALEARLASDGSCLLEQYIVGREIQVALLEDRALPSIEIRPGAGFYDYTNKYQPGAAEELCPAPIPADWEAAVEQAALTVYRTLGLSVYARADFIVDDVGTPWFLEINTLPGMTPTSLVPQEAAAAGIGYGELCQRIIDASIVCRGRR